MKKAYMIYLPITVVADFKGKYSNFSEAVTELMRADLQQNDTEQEKNTAELKEELRRRKAAMTALQAELNKLVKAQAEKPYDWRHKLENEEVEF